MSDLSKNAKCVLMILEREGSLTTSEILEVAKQEPYSQYCSDCAGGDSFVAAANHLVNEGLIERKFGKGGYRWELVKE
ncbi:hypothetical protein EU537_06265 [Candidatus Thorarchaeota archaeon]|nr:MAG: hypothetical protein EU537_06265 [Candidatus Thorarchaeota archaeon]